MKRLGALAMTAATGVLLAASVAAPAQADDRLGTRVSGPEGSCANKSIENAHVKVCFAAFGEWLYVQDKAADGRSAYGQILVPEVKDPCRNKFGAGTWAKCNYSVPEYLFVMYQGYTQDNGGLFDPKHDITDLIREEAS
jgi:hypothetical protein